MSTGGQSYAHLYYTTFKNFIYDLNLIVICGIILSGDKKKDRELIARIIINILDVKNCQQWELFTGEDMYEQVCNYVLNISKGNNTAEEYARKMMEENKPVIDRIVQGEDIPNEEYNVFTESFRKYNRKFRR